MCKLQACDNQAEGLESDANDQVVPMTLKKIRNNLDFSSKYLARIKSIIKGIVQYSTRWQWHLKLKDQLKNNPQIEIQ